jgi:multiple RNA-binding domain-containing protein 1
MNQDTVATSMAKQLNQTKGEFFDKEAGGSMAVKMAKSETIIINQTKQWLKDENIIDFDVLDRTSRVECKRNNYILLVKNLPYTAKEAELKELFERYGELKRFMLSPFNTLAIAEYTSKSFAKAALKNLAYHKVNFVNPIYLEYAPKGFVRKTVKVAGSDDDEEEKAPATKEDVSEKQSR